MYIVKPVVCDYGIFKVDESSPLLILNHNINAALICDILNYDEVHDGQHHCTRAIDLSELISKYNTDCEVRK